MKIFYFVFFLATLLLLSLFNSFSSAETDSLLQMIHHKSKSHCDLESNLNDPRKPKKNIPDYHELSGRWNKQKMKSIEIFKQSLILDLPNPDFYELYIIRIEILKNYSYEKINMDDQMLNYAILNAQAKFIDKKNICQAWFKKRPYLNKEFFKAIYQDKSKYACLYRNYIYVVHKKLTENKKLKCWYDCNIYLKHIIEEYLKDYCIFYATYFPGCDILSSCFLKINEYLRQINLFELDILDVLDLDIEDFIQFNDESSENFLRSNKKSKYKSFNGFKCHMFPGFDLDRISTKKPKNKTSDIQLHKYIINSENKCRENSGEKKIAGNYDEHVITYVMSKEMKILYIISFLLSFLWIWFKFL